MGRLSAEYNEGMLAMEKTLLALPGALLALGLVLLGACGGDALPVLSASSALVGFGEIAVGESGSATLRVANVGAAEAEIELSGLLPGALSGGAGNNLLPSKHIPTAATLSFAALRSEPRNPESRCL